MRIIRWGNLPEHSSRITCKACRCILMVTIADANRIETVTNRTYAVFGCPCCKEEIYISYVLVDRPIGNKSIVPEK